MYNGNIAGIINNIPSIAAPIRFNRRSNTMFGMLYVYDQLNRMTGSISFPYIRTNGNFLEWDPYQYYYENLEYDRNGNIFKLRRGGMTSPTQNMPMDDLYYNYYAHSNRLSYVRDKIPAGNYSIDLDSQFVNNYRYDAIGNLVRDSAEGITRIAWTVYGKIDSIYKSNGTVISYRYDAGGNRILKKVNNTETVYVRDATGNVMSTYSYDSTGLWQKEIHLYGSSRLGIHQLALNLTAPDPIPMITVGNITGKKSIFERGNKFFELINHLGNVNVVVSDRKKPVPNTGNPLLLSKYMPVVISAQDYYPFGMVMPQRSFSSGSYRYGFNGKENDNEVKGTWNQQDYGMRIYDPRLGRFLSVDPITNEYPELSPYQYASNTPIQAIDLDGLESWSLNEPQAKLKREAEAKISMLQNPKPKPVSFFSSSQTKIGPAPPPSEYSRKLSEQKLDEYYRNQALAKANLRDPVAAQVGFGLTNTAGQFAKAPIDHGIGTYEGVQEGDWWKAGKNAAFLALDFYAAAGGVRALAGTETYFRAMSEADFAIMQKTGKMPATAETFISPTAAYSSKYEGVLVEINTKSGTFNQLKQVGVADPKQPLTTVLKLGKVENGWNSSKAFFKQEAGQVNIGLGQGKALEIFNNNIKNFKKIERPTP